MSRQRALLVGVTGTNGKTSITSFIAQLSRSCGTPGAAVGQRIELGEQNLDRCFVGRGTGALEAAFKKLEKQAHCQLIACEVYSAAIARRAHDDIPYDCAVFSNLATDHLDVHGSAERYHADKLGFLKTLRAGTPLLVPVGGRREDVIIAAARQADLDVKQVVPDHWPDHFSAHFLNVNAALALEACLVLGFSEAALRSASAALVLPPGRMVQRNAPNGALIVVDFAHNPHGLATVLHSLRTRVNGQVNLILSSKGGWAREKRQTMGKVASELADQVFITDDDPRQEDPALIRRQLFVDPRFRIVAGRRRAIAAGINSLGPDDALLVAGRGEDPGFVTAHGRIAHNDLSVVDSLVSH